jgi:hypothetical protein
MTRRGWRATLWIPAFLAIPSLLSHSLNAQKPASPPASPERVVLNRYCVTCHNERLKTGGLLLDQMDPANVGHDAAAWEKVVQKLQTGSMPPIGRSRPDRVSINALVVSLETGLDRAAEAKPEVGRPLLHRLNRFEYANAIRDLLALEIDTASLLPPDDSSFGFDNVADRLDVSPLLLDQYLTAARKISRLAVGDPAVTPTTETYRNSPDLTQDDHLEGLPLGTRGGLTVRHTFPLDAEYEIRLRLVRNLVDFIRGLGEPQQIDVMLDGVVVQQFVLGGPDFNKPVEGSTGGQAGTKALRADEPLRFRLPVTAGPHAVSVAFVKKSLAESEDLLQPALRSFADNVTSVKGVAHLQSVSIAGPYGPARIGDTPSRQRLFICRPTTSATEEACARTIISTFARRAYRGPVADADLRVLLTFYESARHEGGTFEAGIQMAVRRILASPQFVFRFERDPAKVLPGTMYRISDIELASRLSFFLWSSIPDDALLTAAEQGRLRDPVTLDKQVRRMLADPRSESLVTNFAGQWLQLRNLRGTFPNLALFPDFDDNLRQGFQRETELLVETIIRENRSAIDFLDADYTFVNERLARHYGIPNVYGSHFRRVTLTDDRRQGLLGQGSILTLTSYANRTAPTIRGKWVLENILGVPPPPPPPNAPSLKDEDASKGGKVLTMRERMAEHRANPVCASCHASMDPLGFGLENFDALGRWRETSDGGVPIDASGTLSDGTKFVGPAALRKALLEYREAFVTTLTTKLMTYALGRGVEYYDKPAIRQILRESASDDYRWSSLILGVIKSPPFQMRTSAVPASTNTAASAAVR